MLKEYMENEIWKDVFGYEGLYQVSNLGRVKSLWYDKERILKPASGRDGYLRVNLYKDGKVNNYLVHRLVAQAFIQNDNLFKTEINHKDENKTNNNVSNLEWCTAKYNINYGTRNERISTPVIQYNLEGKAVAFFPSAIEVQRRLGFSQSNISACCNGKLNTAYKYKWKYA